MPVTERELITKGRALGGTERQGRAETAERESWVSGVVCLERERERKTDRDRQTETGSLGFRGTQLCKTPPILLSAWLGARTQPLPAPRAVALDFDMGGVIPQVGGEPHSFLTSPERGVGFGIGWFSLAVFPKTGGMESRG